MFGRVLLAGATALALTGAAFAADPGVSDTEIKIGDISILSGPAKFVGDGVVLGSKIAAAEINANGGVNGRKIVIVTEDDGYVPARSVQALQKLISEDEIFALNGTSGSSNILAMLPIIEEEGLPTVVTTAPNSKVYEEKGAPPTVFSIGPGYATPFYAQVKYIHEHLEPANATYGLIIQDDDFGDSIEQGYDKAVKEFGLKDAIRIRYKKGQSDFAPEVLKLREAGVNVLVSGAIFGGQASIFKEARKLNLDLQAATVWVGDMPISVKLFGPTGYPYLVADYVVAFTDPAAQAFVENAKKYVGDEALSADRYTYVTYVGLKVLAEAMSRCGKDLTRACTVEQLDKMENFDAGGLMAPITFDERNKLAGTAVKIYQFDPTNSGFKTLTEFTNY